jgi:hypothetical protein
VSWAGVALGGPARSGGSSAATATAMPRPGGPPTRCWAAGDRTGTTDPARLPKGSTWYLLTNLARPASRPAQQTQLAEIVAAYGLRNWVEQGYKQVKDELGWADFQVRSDRAIRRHWTLVCCAFSLCWHAGQPQGWRQAPGQRRLPRWPRPTR